MELASLYFIFYCNSGHIVYRRKYIKAIEYSLIQQIRPWQSWRLYALYKDLKKFSYRPILILAFEKVVRVVCECNFAVPGPYSSSIQLPTDHSTKYVSSVDMAFSKY